jgi:hypothetical protein
MRRRKALAAVALAIGLETLSELPLEGRAQKPERPEQAPAAMAPAAPAPATEIIPPPAR